jgi:uncharacterized delta-60 repeat protein
MAVQPDGKIIIGGAFTILNASPRNRLARVNTDGSVDGTFDSPTSDGDVYNIALQPDGRILIGGRFSNWNGLPYEGVARLRSDGSLDTSFGRVAFVKLYEFTSVAGQSDGKVVIGGGFSNVNGTNRNNVARLNSNGTLDLTFDPGAGANSYVTAVGVQTDDKVIVAGRFTSMAGVPCSHLARLNPNGSVDTNFTASLAGPNFDNTFIVMLPDDKFMLGGYITSVSGYSRNGIARLNADGSVDTTFQPGAGANGPVWAAAVQSDGKVLVGGAFTSFDGIPRKNVARLLPNGTVDAAFNPGAGANNVVYAVGAQLDGKAVIGGDFTQFNGTNINRIARLNGDTSSTDLQFLAANRYFGTWLAGTASNTYRIEWTTNVSTPSLWTPLFNLTLQTNPQFLVDPNLPAGQRFYRAVRIAP